MSDQRDSVRSNAKYLRNVRPIDPEEICEYVEGTPHPAVVRQHLRELAPERGLELIEREDGTFVPVEDDPVSPNPGAVESFPSTYSRALEDLLVERYGANWHADASGNLLRSTIRRFKERYLEGRPVEYDDDVATGYAIYHLPGYYAAVQYALDDLAQRGLLGQNLRVLDVGAGVGGPALGLADYLPEDALLEYHAIEPSAAADVLETLLAETGRNVHTTVHRTTAEAFDPATIVDEGRDDAFDPTAPDDGFDLVLACNVLSELEDPEAVLRRYLRTLAPDGTVLAMAPADKNTSIQLRDLERRLEDERVWDRADASASGGTEPLGPVTVYGPPVRLWPGERPEDRGWSFDARPDLETPPFQRKLEDAVPADDPDHEPGEFVNVDVQFSYSLLRLDGTRRIDLELDTGDWARMAEMERHVPNRIDVVAAKLSRSLSDAEEGSHGGPGGRSNPLFKISDGSERVDHYAVVTNETALNRPLLEADYGDVCSFEQALALWNDDEEAYNLVVDEETIVDRIG
ncbi:small ribosomal subunit Rsm22 family protein [Halobiforma nitratireducens]|uniref:Methyltransferase type 12 n=1 Tax=Halobiforma nitratireducens JCM 10879 TaxID=1227454 RepID=M0LYW9_9EURY|nr:class I SAM-dependent methyltransferase [Halobiforma nitratireducens]EMA37320.1 methyltransferase type 12 [Halobiforma nitratireducens JCM 10879]